MTDNIERGTGPLQIIPTLGAHEGIRVGRDAIAGLLMADMIEYQPEYGPNANIYRPKGSVDAETIRSWLNFF